MASIDTISERVTPKASLKVTPPTPSSLDKLELEQGNKWMNFSYTKEKGYKNTEKPPVVTADEAIKNFITWANADGKLEQKEFRNWLRSELGNLFDKAMSQYEQEVRAAQFPGWIAWLQATLARIYPELKIGSDGHFWPVTLHALTLFQQEYKLEKWKFGNDSVLILGNKKKIDEILSEKKLTKQFAKVQSWVSAKPHEAVKPVVAAQPQATTWVSAKTVEAVKPPKIEKKKGEGMLMGILSDMWVQDTIDKVSKSFNVATERMMALITRESSWEVKAKSSTGSKWITQLTTSVFRDIWAYVNKKGKRVGRWVAEYADNLKKIPSEITSAIWGKFDEVVQKIKMNVSKEKPDLAQNEQNIKELQKLVSQATDKWDYRPNLLLGTLYYSSIADRYRNVPLAKMQNEVQALQKMNRWFFNSMLEAKNFSPLSPSEFEDFKKELMKDEQKMRDFSSIAAYNGQANTHHWVKHKIYYAAVIMASEKQIKQNQDGLYMYS
jgi:peptidoglycan hydrolase-like protein with peptidoglycan-binding domain